MQTTKMLSIAQISVSGAVRTPRPIGRGRLTLSKATPHSTAVTSHTKLSESPKSAQFSQVALQTAILSLAAPALPALADETAGAGASTEATGGFIFTPLGFALAFSPLVVYGLFYLYREKVNPRATLGDLLFVIAALVIVGNIVSTLVFKVRLY